MATNYENNLEIEKYLERIHTYLSQVKSMIRDAKPNSVPVKLVYKCDFLSASMESMKSEIRLKERRE